MVGLVKSFALHLLREIPNPHAFISVSQLAYRRDPGKRILSSKIIRLLDVCQPTLPLISVLPSLRSYVLPRKTEEAYKRKRGVIQGGHP